ncbi:MAG: penicillin acylase family protein, partial [Stackebrandtia sp.]
MTVTWNIRRSFVQTTGSASLPGLSAQVEVSRDDYGIPQVYADTATDLFAAQGYVQAQDRFFEMDFRRHITSGRLSEMFGESQVATDATIRTMGWRQVAEQEWENLDGVAREYFQAYADGVNAYLAGKAPGEASLEYTILGLNGLDYHIESWSPVDSLAWLKAMAWDLRGNYSEELGRATMLAEGLPTDKIAELYPSYPGDHAPIVPQGTVVDGEFDASATDTSPSPRVPVAASGDNTAAALSRTDQAVSALDSVLGPRNTEGIGSN